MTDLDNWISRRGGELLVMIVNGRMAVERNWSHGGSEELGRVGSCVVEISKAISLQRVWTMATSSGKVPAGQGSVSSSSVSSSADSFISQTAVHRNLGRREG